jgi:hypothetical protein
MFTTRSARLAGNLKTDDKQKIEVEKEIIKIVPSDPQVIYVPQYNPTTVVTYSTVPVYGYYPSPYPVYYYCGPQKLDIACLSYGNAHRSCERPPAGTKILAGLLPKSVMHCCARSCSLQRTLRTRGRGFKSCRARQYSMVYELHVRSFRGLPDPCRTFYPQH